MSTGFVDESDVGFGWIESAKMQRTSHALVAGGRVWILDPIEAPGSTSAFVRWASRPA